MFLHLLATVRPTETWAPLHLVAVFVVAVVTVLVVRWIRVRRPR